MPTLSFKFSCFLDFTFYNYFLFVTLLIVMRTEKKVQFFVYCPPIINSDGDGGKMIACLSVISQTSCEFFMMSYCNPEPSIVIRPICIIKRKFNARKVT